uniref:Uncharacterized protein n=1 Tax=Anguilla anguilla TaxID=7936 RepID=A0A0E9W7V0_ANGAN
MNWSKSNSIAQWRCFIVLYGNSTQYTERYQTILCMGRHKRSDEWRGQ